MKASSRRRAASLPSRSGTGKIGRSSSVRDRVGICPLYYTEADGWLLWGSEIKALLASGLVDARPDPKGIDLFFNTFCAGTTRTFFEGIKSIPPGHFLRIRDGRVELKKYWDLDFPDAGAGAPARRPDSAGRRAGIPDAAGGRAPAARRRAGGQLYQRRPGLDGDPGPELATARQCRPVVHDRAGQGRTGRAVARTRIGPDAGLEAFDRDDEPCATSWPPIPS